MRIPRLKTDDRKAGRSALSASFLLKSFATPISQQSSHRISLIISSVLISVLVIAFYIFGAFPSSSSDTAIKKGEIDISGPWKLSTEDNSKFKRLNFDDSLWCYSGVPDPNLGVKNSKNPNCTEKYYPAEKMRGNTYWYRTWIEIPAGFSWEDPSIFFGAIKEKAWVYWDETLVAIIDYNKGALIGTAQLEKNQALPGRHLLSIRVKSENTRYPGIFHAYPRKVTLGSSSNNTSQVKRIIYQTYIYPSFTAFTQSAGLLITLILLLFGRGSSSSFSWLILYFFSTTIYSTSFLVKTGFEPQIAKISLAITSISIFGFSLRFHQSWAKYRHVISKILALTLFLSLFLYTYFAYSGNFYSRQVRILTLTIAVFPLLAFSASVFLEGYRYLVFFDKRRSTFSSADIISLVVLGFLHALNMASEFLFINTPIITGHPALKALLSFALVVTMIYQYTQQERTLAFFGRFIRPGLKSLLKEQIEKSLYSDGKIFRPRQIAIMKIDIVNHTETTFQMPYGIKRLYQDTWFTMIDQVVSERVFLDKNVGDGSIYCFSETHKEGSCGSALIAALQIRDDAVSHFDTVFRQRLEEVLLVTEELQAPAQLFFENYKSRTGRDFWHRNTIVRIGLVYGFVDEGLWGLSSQSHYDVQGDLVSLAARIESKAKDNEILMDEAFVKGAGTMLTQEMISPRLETLKGMGEVKVFAIKAKNLKLAV